MFLSPVRTKIIGVLSIIGTIVAVAAGLAEHVNWLASICGGIF